MVDNKSVLPKIERRGDIEMGSKFSDVICFVLGPFITIGSLLGLIYHFDIGLGLREKATYFYPISLTATASGLGVGIGLICLGLLIRYRSRHPSATSEKNAE